MGSIESQVGIDAIGEEFFPGMRSYTSLFTSISFVALFCLLAFPVNGQDHEEEQCAIDFTDSAESGRSAGADAPPASGMDLKLPLTDDSLEADPSKGENSENSAPPEGSKRGARPDSSSKYHRPQDFDLKSALAQIALMQSVQHGVRLLQPKTRRELDGPFFKDWWRSVNRLKGWRDGDNSFTNYFAHPLQGSVTGRIYIANSRKARNAEFGNSKTYWKGRLTAFAWSALWSTQFEIGPVSEATIGNVGLRRKNGYSTMSWVDLVMTPAAGTGIVIAEDFVEKKLLRKMVKGQNGKAGTKVKILRSLLTPSMSVQNILRLRAPWKRDPLNY